MSTNALKSCLILLVAMGTIVNSQLAFCQRQGEPEVPHVLDKVPSDLMLQYFHKEAEKLSSQHQGSAALSDWQERREQLRGQIWRSLGNFPMEDRPAVKARITGTVDHGDHTVEKIVYESMPGLCVTALAYVPKGLTEPAPAVICVNGHWSEAKSTPIIQRRCMMLARMGVIAFCQDVIGTGERAAFEGSEPTTYHGFYRGAAARIVDRSLLGYIMVECFRANDYLRSRPDVDPERIMCTGASGGGKQSMFFPALDERLAGGVPVCYVSSYVDHIGATACVGEVPTGVLRYTDQWEILGLHAPRPLLCLAATRDVPVFSPAPMKQTLGKVKRRVYQFYDQDSQVGFQEFDSKHDYNKPMRERFFSHVAEHLLGQPNTKIPEPEDLPVETAETLRCGLPAGSETMQSLTFRRAQELVSRHEIPSEKKAWLNLRRQMLTKIEHEILGGFPSRDDAKQIQVRELVREDYREQHWKLETEEGIVVPAVLFLSKDEKGLPKDGNGSAVLVVDEDGKQHALNRGLVEQLVSQGHTVLAIDYRGAGETAGTVPSIGYGPGTPEYNLSNYALFLGRPLMGMRAHDIRCAVDFLLAHPEIRAEKVALVGRGRGALVALFAAMLDERVETVVAEGLLSSWVFAEEFVDVGLSTLIPSILTVGDVEHLAACVAPRRLLIVNPVDGRNRQLGKAQISQIGNATDAAYRLYGASERLKTVTVAEGDVLSTMASWLESERE